MTTAMILSILVATIAGFILGGLWYAPRDHRSHFRIDRLTA